MTKLKLVIRPNIRRASSKLSRFLAEATFTEVLPDLGSVSKQHLKSSAGNAVSDASKCQQVCTEKTLDQQRNNRAALSQVNVLQTL